MRHLNQQQLETLRQKLQERAKSLGSYQESIREESPINDPERLENKEAGDEAFEAYEILESEALGGESAAMLAEVKAALQRMREGTYGVDEKTGEPIPYERLLLLPEARTVA